MNTFRLTFQIDSALGTPVMGDTLFGHICWGIRWWEGETALQDFLESYRTRPPLVISNAFPAGMLPMPLLEPAPPENDISLERYQQWKKLRKVRYLPFRWFTDPDFQFSEKAILERLAELPEPEKQVKQVERLHNTINRLTGTVVGEQSPFAVPEIWYPAQASVVEVYVRTEYPAERIRALFEQALINGYGADKSTGKGKLTLLEVEPVKLPDTGNRAMALGHFVPSPDDSLQELRADLFTRYGKLGGFYVFTHNPFKKPILMYRQGSTFGVEPEKAYVGMLLDHVHSDAAIRHHALAPVVFFNEKETGS
jgi:CRISPR-associated protein Csm4